MNTKFDLADKTTWPPENEPVIVLFKSGVLDSVIMCADWSFPKSPILFWNLCGVSGYDCDPDAREENIIAWQPIPSWGDLDQ